jgi:hypothetical protein
MMIVPPRRLPEQSQDKILLHATRWRRASDAQLKWAEPAKRCVDYYENRQWSAADIQKLMREKRPVLTLNKIKSLVNLVAGYFINNRTDIAYMPGLDGFGVAEVAAALTHLSKQISERNQLPFVDTEVFMDGLVTGRGFFHSCLDFSHNQLGELRWKASDNFSTYPDPDCDQYDLNTGTFIDRSRWASWEEVAFYYGPEVASLLGPFMQGGGVSSGMPMSQYDNRDEVSPMRGFALEEGDRIWQDYFYDFIDPSRKAIRIIEEEHYVRCNRWFFVDLETGDKRAVPDEWNRTRCEQVLRWARDEMRQPLVLQMLPTRRLRLTHIIGDVIAYDSWSVFDSFSTIGFFPYFRRGMTQGMVEPLLDAQDEVNKRRAARLNLLGRVAAGGWIYPRGSLDAQQKANLDRYGSTPGLQVEWDSKEGKLSAPQPITPGVIPANFAALEKDAEEDMLKIAGINASAMGQIDTAAASGRAIERRQRQAVIGQEQMMLNFRRTKELCGRKQLEVVQKFYTEERVIRVTGTGRSQIQMVINQRTAAGVVNDITLGSYSIAVDETPLSRSFLEAQFEEFLELKGLGLPIPDDFLIDATSATRKEELKAAVAMARAQEAALAAQGLGPGGAPAPEGQNAPGPGPGGSRTGRDGGSLPAGPEPGAPPAPAATG